MSETESGHFSSYLIFYQRLFIVRSWGSAERTGVLLFSVSHNLLGVSGSAFLAFEHLPILTLNLIYEFAELIAAQVEYGYSLCVIRIIDSKLLYIKCVV